MIRRRNSKKPDYNLPMSEKQKNTDAISFFNFLINDLNLSRASASSLLSHYFNLSKNDLFLNPGLSLKLDDNIILDIERIKKGYPVAYILKSAEFYGLNLYVDENVLIPRPETELLVDEVLKRCSGDSYEILDLCTGSGCILSALLNNLKNSSGCGIDISLKAIKTAKKNAENLNLNALLIRGDCLTVDKAIKKKFDIITCNPPYVGFDDEIEDSLKFEPQNAIFAEDDGLYFYKNLLSITDKLCKKNGLICFEIGFNMKDKLIEICEKHNIKPEFIKDYSGNDRIMIWKNL